MAGEPDRTGPRRLIRARLAVALVALLLGLWLAAVPALADEPLTMEAYRRAVAEAVTLLDRALTESRTDAQQALLDDAAAKLASVQAVQFGDGTRAAVDNARLAGEVRDARNAGRVREARARVQALRDTLNTLPGLAMTGPEAASLSDIYNRPPFKAEPPPDNPLARAILEALARALETIARAVFEARDLVVVFGVLVLLAMIGYFLFNLRRQSASEASLPSSPADAEDGLTASQALENAQRMAAAGDYRMAVRQLYLSTLLWLDEHGRLEYDRTLTNREYLRALAGAPAVRNALAPVVETFDRIWYGFAPVTSVEFERYEQAVDALRRL